MAEGRTVRPVVPEGSSRAPTRPESGREMLPHGFQLDSHRHEDGQVVWVSAGLAATTTSRGTWLAPPDRVTWTPPQFDHAHRFSGHSDARAVTVPAADYGRLPTTPRVLPLSGLVREVLVALSERDGTPEAMTGHLLSVLVDELAVLDAAHTEQGALHLPEPRDDRLSTATDLLRADPTSNRTLAQIGREVGASERTLSRLFREQLGMGFVRWRATLRIHLALSLLAEGCTVMETAHRLGWANPSTFIEAFTAIVGQTPGRYRTAATRSAGA